MEYTGTLLRIFFIEPTFERACLVILILITITHHWILVIPALLLKHLQQSAILSLEAHKLH